MRIVVIMVIVMIVSAEVSLIIIMTLAC